MIEIIWNILNIIAGIAFIIVISMSVWYGVKVDIGKEKSNFHIEFILNPLKDYFK